MGLAAGYECYEEPIYLIAMALVDALRERYPDLVITQDCLWRYEDPPKRYQILCQEQSTRGTGNANWFFFRILVTDEMTLEKAANKFAQAHTVCWEKMLTVEYANPQMMDFIFAETDAIVRHFTRISTLPENTCEDQSTPATNQKSR